MTTETANEAARKTGRPIRVMLVDDHPTMLWGLTALIDGQRPNMEVVAVASSCAEVLEKISLSAADVVLLDLDLGGSSGVDILPQLIAQSRLKVLLFTGEQNQAKLDVAVAQGARGILRKDASAAHVLRAIERTAAGEIWLDRVTVDRMFDEIARPKAVPVPDPEIAKHATLTCRERKIVGALVECNGAPNRSLAASLFISDHTLRNHLTSIYQKLELASRLELYIYAVKHKLGAPIERSAQQPTPS